MKIKKYFFSGSMMQCGAARPHVGDIPVGMMIQQDKLMTFIQQQPMQCCINVESTLYDHKDVYQQQGVWRLTVLIDWVCTLTCIWCINNYKEYYLHTTEMNYHTCSTHLII